MNRTLPVFRAILLAALTAACFGSLPDTDAQRTAAPAALPPANYREIIHDAQSADSPTDEAQVQKLYADAGVGTAQGRCAAIGRLGGMSQVRYEAGYRFFRRVHQRPRSNRFPALGTN